MRKISNEVTSRGQVLVASLRCGEPDIDITPPTSPFMCGVELGSAWDRAWLLELLKTLIRRGAALLAFHGVGCEQAHDIADTARQCFPETDDRFVLTTWHDDVSFVDFMEELAGFLPSADYIRDNPQYLILLIGGRDPETLLSGIREIFV